MISENEFRLGNGCPTKILHSRAGLLRNDVDDGFSVWMRAEAERFRCLARNLFPCAVTGNLAERETFERLSTGQSYLGATLVTPKASCRVDVIEPDGLVLRLYQFTPKAVDLERHAFGLEFCSQSGWLRREWREHFELLAFRMSIAQELFPDQRIVPLIVVPVTAVPATVEGLHSGYEVKDGSWQFSGTTVGCEASSLLRIIGVTSECTPLIPSVVARVMRLNAFLEKPVRPMIGYSCKKCQFKVPNEASGFERCWGSAAAVQPSMFDLGYMYFIQDDNRKPVADRLAREGRVSLWDIPRDKITGEHAPRQLMQLEGTEAGIEIIRPELALVLADVVYPLVFLDIETLRTWLPAHRGESVNELVLFQFSLHVMSALGTELKHVGWLNTETSHPNERFLAALRAALGDTGTVCVWTQYEEQSFAELLSELIGHGRESDNIQWLRCFLTSERVLDLHAVCFRCHFHPLMKGRTSIKSVLPALWSVDSPVKRRAPYSEFPTGIDPYAVLKRAGMISDGVMAMEGYLEVIRSSGESSLAAAKALERYCYVDTLAMAFVFDYWLWALTSCDTKLPSGRENSEFNAGRI